MNIINYNIENNFESESNYLLILIRLKLIIIELILIIRRNFNKLNAEILREILVRIIVSKEYLITLRKNNKNLINDYIDY